MVPFGTDETISRVVREYSPMLLRLACTRLDDPADAEDAVQETFLKLLTARPAFRDDGHEKAWLIRTTLHRASDIRRAAEKRNLPLEEAARAAAPEEGSELLAAVRALPEKYSAVIHQGDRQHAGPACPHGGDPPGPRPGAAAADAEGGNMMDREEYRRAFDQLSFSPDFQSRTEALLRRRARELEKEKLTMHFKKTRKMAVLIAASLAVLPVSVSAAVLFLSPADVAEEAQEPVLAAAFQSESAITINESAQVGEYTVTMDGMVSGAELSKEAAEYNGEIISDRTYAVYHVVRTDGKPLQDYPDLTYTPLVEGYHVSAVNAWTLGGGQVSFLRDGVAYHLFDTRNLEMFADHTVYFAVYEGSTPSVDQFSMTKEGAISLRDNVDGMLFTLPLDESKADPAAAEAVVQAVGIPAEPITDEELAEGGSVDFSVEETEAGGSRTFIIQDAQ